MGCVSGITETKYPKQSALKGARTGVIFHYGREEFMGTIIRDDMEPPHEGASPLTVILLDDGRVVMATECQYAPRPVYR